jgi:cytochrome c peroxidase
MRTSHRSRLAASLVPKWIVVPGVLGAIAAAVAPSAVIAQGGPPPPPPPLTLPATAPAPAGNPITASKTNLGKALFYEEQMSSNRTVACATCHINSTSGSDPRAASPGSVHPGPDALFQTADDIHGSRGTTRTHADGSYELATPFRLEPQVTSRRSMSAINAGFVPQLFWDGRAPGQFRDPLTNAVVLAGGAALESQVVGPPVSDVEMGHVGRGWSDVASRVAASQPLRLASNVPSALSTWINGRSYPELFQEVFGTPDVTPARIAMSIATYERTLSSNQAPVFAPPPLPGQPPPLTQQEAAGRQIFNTIGRCNVCHVGPRFTDDLFHYIGVRPQNEDLGRFAITGQQGDRGEMKTPTLLNVELRAPYFHNGAMATLEDVVDFYDRGGDFNAPNKPLAIAPIGLTAQQKANLVAFLKRPLTDPRVAAQTAPFDRPTLYTESSNVATHYGQASYALEPAYIGNPSWTAAMDHGNAGHSALLVLCPSALVPGVPFQGATLNVSLANLHIVRAGTLDGTGPGDGWASRTFPLTTDPALAGVPMFAQWFVLDPDGVGRRWAATEGTQVNRF